jgi:hypothetical protein
MSLAQAWRRQLLGASSAALIVPLSMLAALVALALGGGFSQVGVLGQIFAGPPAIGATDAGSGGGGVAVGLPRSVPVVPSVATAIRRPRPGRRVVGSGATSRPSNRTDAAGRAPIVTAAPIRSTPRPGPGASSRPAPGSSPQPSPSPAPHAGPPSQPTAVDKVVTVVTPVTQQVPAPVGPSATQLVQAAGSAADGLLPPAQPGTLP